MKNCNVRYTGVKALGNNAAREMAGAVTVLAWLTVVFIFYFRRSPFLLNYLVIFLEQYRNFSLWHSYTWKAVTAFLLATWITWVTIKIGAQFLRKLLPESELTDLERSVFSAALGIGILSLVTLILGVLHLWYVGIFWSVLLLTTLWFLPKSGFPLTWNMKFRVTAPVQEWWWAPVSALLAFTGLLFLIGDVCPEIFYDSLHYHLAVPNLYLLRHRVYSEPHFAYSNLIMTVQMFWGFALTIGNEITVKLLHGASAILLLLAFIAFERRYLSEGSGALAALFFLSMPLVGLKAITAGIDVVRTSLEVVSAFALARALSNDHEEHIGRQWMRLAGIFAGLAASSKYTDLPSILVACLIIVWRKRIHEQRLWSAVFRQVALFVLYAVLVVSPYLMRNFIFHQNPIYPFAGTVWGDPPITAENWRNLANETTRNLANEFLNLSSALRFIFHPWFISMPGKFGDDYIGPVFLGLLPLLLLARPHNPGYQVLGLYSLGLWLVWLASTFVLRFNMPALALVSLLLAHGLLSLRGPSAARHALMTLSLIGVAWNVYFTFMVFTFSEGWHVIGGMVSQHDYLTVEHTTYPAPDYEALDWMNKNLTPAAMVMIAGDSRSYYTRIPVVPSSIYDPQPIVEAARRAKDGTDMARSLRRQGVTHLFVNLGEALRTEGYKPFPWDKQSWTVLEDFWHKYVRLIWTSSQAANLNKLFVYQILSDPDGDAPPNPFEHWRPR
jgi:hypothetical protein